MGRTTSTQRELVGVRLDPADIRRIEMLREHFDMPWHQATQSDVLRALIFRGLEDMERTPARVLRAAGLKPPAKGEPKAAKGQKGR